MLTIQQGVALNVKNDEWVPNLNIEGRRHKDMIETAKIEEDIQKRKMLVEEGGEEENLGGDNGKPFMNSMTNRLHQSAKIVGLDMYEEESRHYYPSNLSSPALSTRSKLRFAVGDNKDMDTEERSGNVRKVLLDVQTMSADSDFGDKSLLMHLDTRKASARSRMVERRMREKGD